MEEMLSKIIKILEDIKFKKDNEDVLYTIEETANLIKSNKDYVYSLIKNSQLQAIKLGRLKVTRTELLNFLERNQGKDLSDPSNIKNIEI